MGGDYNRPFPLRIAGNVFLASHASQFGLHRKYTPGDAHDPARFVDPAGFRAAVERLEKTSLAQLASDRRSLCYPN